jgi:hypothetical protein
VDFCDGHDGMMVEMTNLRSNFVLLRIDSHDDLIVPKVTEFIDFATIRNGLRKAVGVCMECHMYADPVNESPSAAFSI